MISPSSQRYAHLQRRITIRTRRTCAAWACWSRISGLPTHRRLAPFGDSSRSSCGIREWSRGLGGCGGSRCTGVILRIRPARSAHAYRQIWTDAGSPLLLNSQALVAAIRDRLASQTQRGRRRSACPMDRLPSLLHSTNSGGRAQGGCWSCRSIRSTPGPRRPPCSIESRASCNDGAGCRSCASSRTITTNRHISKR